MAESSRPPPSSRRPAADEPEASQSGSQGATHQGDPNLQVEVEYGAHFGGRQIAAQENIGRPFNIDIIALSPIPTELKDYDPTRYGPTIRLEAIIGRPMAVRVTQDSGLHRVWTGVCSHAELVRWDTAPGSESTYYLRMAPSLWLLSKRVNHRVFQHQTIVEVIEAVLDEWTIDREWRLTEDYPKKEYVVQYGETDLDFVHRLIEEIGIVYFFEPIADGDKFKSQIVLTDTAHKQKKQLDLPYADNPNRAENPLFATNVQLAHRVRSGRVLLSDYNFRRPKQPLFANSGRAQGDEGKRELYEYAPSGFAIETGGPGEGPPDEKVADDKSTTTHDHEAEGIVRARRYLQAARHKKRYVAFETSAQSLAWGTVFAFDDHPHDSISSQSLLAIETMTQVNATGDWSVVGEAVFAKDGPYRIPRVTPKPRVPGVQAAIVVGPKGEEIYTDEFGRVRVRFLWDRMGEFDDNSTCWLRVSQLWAGAQYGGMMVPRVGHEVIVDFFEGDPDQPIVVGRLYTQKSPPPYTLPEHSVKSTWQTNTTPDQPGEQCFNELMFDDAATEELVYVQAERNYMRLTKQDETERTGTDRTEFVGRYNLGVTTFVDATFVGEEHLRQIVKISDMHILDQKDPEYDKTGTFIHIHKSPKIVLTTGGADIVLDGDDIQIETNKGMRLSSEKELIIEGANIYLNCEPAARPAPEIEKLLEDEVAFPEGDALNAIIQLFAQEKLEPQIFERQERAIRAAQEVGAAFCEKCPSTDPPKPDLRQQYEAEVRALEDKGKRMRADGSSEEDIARELYQDRRDIGEKYKDATPEKLREEIYQMNQKAYGDPLGPSFEAQVAKYGGDYKRIQKGAANPGGWGRLNNWLRDKDYEPWELFAPQG